MLAIAVLAGLLAAFGVLDAVTMLVVISVLVLPILCASPRRRLGVAAWVFSLYPLLGLFFLHATWFTACCILGHRPRMMREDNPEFISPIVMALCNATILLILGSPFALTLCVTLVLACETLSVRREGPRPLKAAARLLVLILLWLSPIVVLQWNLFGTDVNIGWLLD
jgi:hypothetical protein